MDQLTFQAFQSYLELKYKEGRTTSGLFMKLVEEIGEVAEVLNQIEGRKSSTPKCFSGTRVSRCYTLYGSHCKSKSN